jgi:CheY-like chemotaxis protein
MSKPIQCILLVDDDPDDNFLHRLAIMESGLCETIREARNGPAALRYLSQTESTDYQRPDIVFLDINMPGMNGFEFLELYHQLPLHQRSRLVVLMLSTSLNPIDEQKARQFKDVGGYYSKPLTKAMLEEVVKLYFRQ